jgi:SnoaL-like domain
VIGPFRFQPNLSHSHNQMKPVSIEQLSEVEQHVYRFWSAMDRRDYSALLACLTERCRWLRGAMIEGHVAILSALEARPSNLTTRHFVNNMIVDAIDDGVIARYLLTTYTHIATNNESPPYDCALPGLIADITMRCVHSGTRPLIDLIEPTIVFHRSGH